MLGQVQNAASDAVDHTIEESKMNNRSIDPIMDHDHWQPRVGHSSHTLPPSDAGMGITPQISTILPQTVRGHWNNSQGSRKLAQL
jgi:hypothetical protein